MTAVAVSRLRLRSPPALAARARHNVEDALRVAPAGPERLLIIRRLALGRIAADARAERWHARASGALAEQAGRAVHGADPTAADAGAVWFRSAAEARALLLRELAAGRRPSAWFWRLAVRDWDGAALSLWLPRWIAAAEGDIEQAVALARAAIAAAEAGLLPAIVAALPLGAPWRTLAPPSAAAAIAGPSATVAGDDGEPAVAVRAPSATRLALRALGALPRPARLAFQAAISEHRHRPDVAPWLARAIVLGAAPEAAASSAAMETAVRAVIEQMAPADAPPPSPGWRPPSSVSPLAERPPARSGSVSSDVPTPITEREPPHPDEVRAEPRPLASPRLTEGAAVAAVSIEAASDFAGLFLLIRPLHIIGLGEWLAARPQVLVDGFARRLLAAIAFRMGADEHDAVVAVLGAGWDGEHWSDELTAWRVGLDRWLRRAARIKLAAVVARSGGFILSGDRLDVRYPPASADIRLRRRALDIDPLWTPWLGLSIRYHYQDQPLQ